MITVLAKSKAAEDAVIQAFRQNKLVLLFGETGTGKTTLAKQFGQIIVDVNQHNASDLTQHLNDALKRNLKSVKIIITSQSEELIAPSFLENTRIQTIKLVLKNQQNFDDAHFRLRFSV